MGRLFPKTFFGLFTLVIWLYNVYFGCLFTKCGFYHVIWKFLWFSKIPGFPLPFPLGRHIYWEKCALNFMSWSKIFFHLYLPFQSNQISQCSHIQNCTPSLRGTRRTFPYGNKIFEWFFSANKQSHSIDVFSWWDCLFT